jgi:hypothetical protein
MKLSLIKSNEIFYNYSIKIRPPWLSGGSVMMLNANNSFRIIWLFFKEEVIGNNLELKLFTEQENIGLTYNQPIK